jgi:hypothetical protein
MMKYEIANICNSEEKIFNNELYVNIKMNPNIYVADLLPTHNLFAPPVHLMQAWQSQSHGRT